MNLMTREEVSIFEVMALRNLVYALRDARRGAGWWRFIYRWRIGGQLEAAESDLRDAREELYKSLEDDPTPNTLRLASESTKSLYRAT